MHLEGRGATADLPLAFPRSYWVVPGLFLAGCYPGDKDPADAERKLAGLLECGVRLVVSLMEEDEVGYSGEPFRPYVGALQRLAAKRGVDVLCERMPVRDMGVPSDSGMRAILDRIDASIMAGQPVYVHCWGGHGRTGTVVGCYLARHSLATGDAALRLIPELRRRAHCPKAGEPSPQTLAQIQMVRQWRPGA